MRIVFLGTGTSCGVPVIGCDCPVCVSQDPRNRRLRSSLYVVAGDAHVLIDTPPDFREQALRERIPRVDAVLFTHAHADHVFGLDDIRRYNDIQGGPIPAYGSAQALAEIRRIFSYANHVEMPGVHRPMVDFRIVEEPFEVGPLRVTPLPVEHGIVRTDGFLLERGDASVAYIPDCAGIDDATVERLRGVDVMILDGLRHRPHSTHLTVAQSVAYMQRIGARQSFITHMTHELDHERTESELPDGIHAAYDGLGLDLSDR